MHDEWTVHNNTAYRQQHAAAATTITINSNHNVNSGTPKKQRST